MAKILTKFKAKKILSEGKAKGRRLTSKQKRFFGAVSVGQKPSYGKTKKRQNKRS